MFYPPWELLCPLYPSMSGKRLSNSSAETESVSLIFLTDFIHWLQWFPSGDFQQRRELVGWTKKQLSSSCRSQCCAFKRNGQPRKRNCVCNTLPVWRLCENVDTGKLRTLPCAQFYCISHVTSYSQSTLAATDIGFLNYFCSHEYCFDLLAIVRILQYFGQVATTFLFENAVAQINNDRLAESLGLPFSCRTKFHYPATSSLPVLVLIPFPVSGNEITARKTSKSRYGIIATLLLI